MSKKSSFPPGSTFWNLNGVPVLINQSGDCTAWDQSAVSHETVICSGTQLTEDQFMALVTAQGRLKNSPHPPETFFAELDGVPVIYDRYGCVALDGSVCSKKLIDDGGRYLSEAEYFALAAIFKAKRSSAEQG